MANVDECGQCRLAAPLYPIWCVNPSVKHQVVRFVCTLLALVVTLYSICLVSVLADSYYIPGQHSPLPDRIHDQILSRRTMPHWLGRVVDLCTVGVVFGAAIRHFLLLPFPLNFQVISRFCTMIIIGFWMRAIAIVVTTVPPSRLNCMPIIPKNAADVLTAAFRQAANHNQECAGMIISGHSLNIMHGFMSFVFYGRCQCAPEKKGKRKGFYCRDVTWKGEPQDTLQGCFLYQCIAFFKLWFKLKKGGCENPAATAATRCFLVTSIEDAQNEQPRRRDPIRKLWRAVTRLPLLRYLCYALSITAWILIPICYNHYTVDVYFAILLGLLWWLLYHLIVTIQLVHKKGISGAFSSPGNSICPKSSFVVPQSTDWRSAGSTAHNSTNKASPISDLAAINDNLEAVNDDEVRIDVCVQRETTPRSVLSETERGQEVAQVTSEKGNPEAPVPRDRGLAPSEFEALNLTWILDFPILQPISWCIRKLEGL